MYGLFFIILIIQIIIASNSKDINNKNKKFNNKETNISCSKTLQLNKMITKFDLQNLDVILKRDLNKSLFNVINKSLVLEDKYFINNIECNSIIDQNEHINKNVKKRTSEYNEPIDLSTKYRCLEKIPTIYDISTNKLVVDEIIFDEYTLIVDTSLKKLVCLESFEYIFKIIENDLINILKNSKKLKILQCEYILPFISNLENHKINDQKIIYFIYIINKILNESINCKINNKNKHMFINKILSKDFKKDDKQKFYNKIYIKAIKINSYKNQKRIMYNDVLNTTIDYLNKTADKKIKILFLYGFQSLFMNFSKKDIPKLYLILSFLHKYNKEKKIYDINWHKLIFELSSVSFSTIGNVSHCYNRINRSCKNDLIKTLNIYMAMNSNESKFAIQNLNDLLYDELHLKYVKYLIDLTNRIKCKLFGIKI